MNVLLVSPAIPTTFWSFKHVLPFVSARAAFPPLGLLTVAGMLPGHWHMKLVDLEVQSLRDRDIAWAVLTAAWLAECRRAPSPTAGREKRTSVK